MSKGLGSSKKTAMPLLPQTGQQARTAKQGSKQTIAFTELFLIAVAGFILGLFLFRHFAKSINASFAIDDREAIPQQLPKSLADPLTIPPGQLFTDIEEDDENSKHILVTGGAGYIGSHAVIRLLEEGHYVTIIDNLSRGNLKAINTLTRLAQGRLAFIPQDLGFPEELTKLLIYISSVRPIDITMHFAGVAFVAEAYSDPLLYYRNVTMNTVNLLKAMEAVECKRLIFSSTCATYGNTGNKPVTEETPQNPVSPYGGSKLMTEKIIKAYGKSNPDFSAVILRYFNVIGADPQGRVGETPRANLPNNYKRISSACFEAALGLRDALTIAGSDHPTPDGTCVRDYIHVSDLVKAHIMAFKAFQPGNVEVFNVGVGHGYSVLQFTEACRAATGQNITVKKGAKRTGDAAAIYSDASKVRRLLGWKPDFDDLEESLQTSWRWAKHWYPR